MVINIDKVASSLAGLNLHYHRVYITMIAVSSQYSYSYFVSMHAASSDSIDNYCVVNLYLNFSFKKADK